MRADRRTIVLGGAALCLTTGGAAGAAQAAGGVFAEADDIARAARRRAALRTFLRLADNRGRRAPEPFVMADIRAVRYGWREKAAAPHDTLREAVDSLTDASAAMRDHALAFALTGGRRHAQRAEALIDRWAARHTPVNLYDFNPDFAAATLDGSSPPAGGGDAPRPWSFALDSMWQCYGAINVADTLTLLRGAGWTLAGDAAAQAWLRRLAGAVNAGLHAWTRWVMAQEAMGHSGPGVARYRSDNHLSWALAGLLAAASALRDDALAAYALDGAAWPDPRAGRVPNPSPFADVVRRAVETAADGPAAQPGRIMEERIRRQPPIGYALFHLEAMTLVAHVAARRFGRDYWRPDTPTGAALAAAYRRYAGFFDGALRSPDPAETDTRFRWLAAMTPAGFGGADASRLRRARSAPRHLTHAVGPVALLFETA